MRDPAQSDQKFQIQSTFETTCFLLMSPHVWSFLLPKFQEAHPSTKKNVLLTASNHSTSQSKTKITCQCTNPFHHLPLPKQLENHQGHGGICWPRPPWPPQRSAARPRRHGRSKPSHAAPSRLSTEDATRTVAAAANKKQSVVMGCFSGWLGKYFWMGHR
jgi:hypothetical protein